MKIVRDDQKIKSKTALTNYLNFGGLACLAAGLASSFAKIQETWFIFVQFGFLLAGIILWQVGLQMGYRYKRRNDVALDNVLEPAMGNSNAAVYHYTLPPEHVLLTRSGPVILHVKSNTGKVTVTKDGNWRWDTPLLRRVMGSDPRFGNPIDEIERSVASIAHHIHKHAPELENEQIPIGAVVVFTAPKAEIELDTKNSSVPAMHVSQLKKFLQQNTSRPLPPEQRDRLEEIFDLSIT